MNDHAGLIRILAAAPEGPGPAIEAVGPQCVLDALMTELASRCEPSAGIEPFVVGYEVAAPDTTLEAFLRIGYGRVALATPEIEETSLRIRTSLAEIHASLFAPSVGSKLPGGGEIVDAGAAAARYEACFPPASDLTELAQRYGSDKWGLHRYTPYYEDHFRQHRDKAVSLLEIGIGGHDRPDAGGASMRMWRQYFLRGQIYGIDIFDKSALNGSRLRTFRGHQGDESFLAKVLEETGPLDIIIDDGSHINRDVLTSFHYLFPRLRAGGLYVIEDLQTAYWPGYGGSSDDLGGAGTSIGFLKTLVDGLNYEEFLLEGYQPTYYDMNVVSLHFYHNLAVIGKGENAEGTIPACRPRVPTVDLPVPRR